MKPIIAIDGVSCSGKGTIAKKLADYFKLAYLDTGKLYRAFGYLELIMSDNSFFVEEYQKSSSLNDQNKLIAYLKNIKDSNLSLNNISTQNIRDFNNNSSNISIFNHLDFSKNIIEEIEKIPETIIRSEIIGMKASEIAKIPKIREIITSMIRKFAYTHEGDYNGIIMDGRDIGTTIFPEADCKIYMTADIKIRAIRRLESVNKKNPNATFNEIYENLKNRDEYDLSHLVNPLNFDKKYIIIDTSHESVETTFANLIKIIEEKFGSNYFL